MPGFATWLAPESIFLWTRGAGAGYNLFSLVGGRQAITGPARNPTSRKASRTLAPTQDSGPTCGPDHLAGPVVAFLFGAALDQLNLGDQIQEPCAVDFEPNPVIVPPGLPGDPKVDVKDLGAWVIMKSFGARAEASLEAYCAKAKCTPDTFRVYQRNLVKAGWMTLIREGRPGKPGEQGAPRLWWMSRVKGEAPPLGVFGEGGKKPDPNRGGIFQPLEKPDPKQGVLVVKKVSSKTHAARDKAPWAAADGTGWQALVDDYAQAFAVAKKNPVATATMIPADFAQLKRLAGTKGFTRAEFQRRLANMGLHDFHARQEFALSYFCTRWREFSDDAEGIKRARGGGRGGRYMAVEKVEDFHGD